MVKAVVPLLLVTCIVLEMRTLSLNVIEVSSMLYMDPVAIIIMMWD